MIGERCNRFEGHICFTQRSVGMWSKFLEEVVKVEIIAMFKNYLDSDMNRNDLREHG